MKYNLQEMRHLMAIPKILLLCVAAIVLLGVLVLSLVLYDFSRVEVYFDINKLDVNDVASHPSFSEINPYPAEGGYFDFWTLSPTGHWGRYRGGKYLNISCAMYDSTYKTLLGLGFTHWQILTAKKEFTEPNDGDPDHKLKVGDRIYAVSFGRFEQNLGNGIGIDRAAISWD